MELIGVGSGKRVELVVIGRPAPKGSSRAFMIKGQNRAVLAPSGSPQNKAALKSWDQSVRFAANEAVSGMSAPPFVDQAISLTVTFRMVRPAGHWGKKGLKPSAPLYPATKPDLAKLARATADSLKGTLYDDDSRIVVMSLRKEYAPTGQEGATIVVDLA